METEDFNKVLEQDYSVDIGGSISQGFEIFKKDPGLFIGYFIINFIISFVLGLIPVIGAIANVIISTFFGIGLYKVIRKIKHGQDFSFNDIFDGFKLDIIQVAGLALMTFAIIMAGFFLLILPGIYIAVAYLFAIPIFSITEKDFWGAMEMSRKIITKQWFSVFAFLIVIFLFNVLGFICFIVGIFITIPISLCAIYVAFEDICQVDSLDNFNSRLENLGKPDYDL